jgi:biopolymer transport protein ExbB
MLRKTRSLANLASALLVLMFAAPAWAQQAAPPGDETILSMIEKSGVSGIIFMVVLGAFSLIAVAITIERLVNLTRNRVLPPAFSETLRTLVNRDEDQPEPFRELCQQQQAPVASILRAGLIRAGRPVVEVEKALEDAAAREVSVLRGRVRPLAVIANVAPLVGLLGTVVGMIMAFYTTSEMGAAQNKGATLAQGIYLALLTTAAGLSIAIPSMLFAAFFNNRIDKYMREMDELLMETMPCFGFMEGKVQRHARATPEPAGEPVVAEKN